MAATFTVAVTGAVIYTTGVPSGLVHREEAATFVGEQKTISLLRRLWFARKLCRPSAG